MVYPKSLESLINYYKKLPGIGEKNAERLALATLNFKEEDIDNFAKSLEDVKKKMEEIEKTWEEKYETMAYYIEHNELEKVQTELTKLKADIDMEEYPMGVENLDSCSFILEHIKDKTALKIVNIF